MKLLLVLDQYDGATNGNTMTARRLAANMREKGHEVRIAASGESRKGEKYGFKEFYIPGFKKLIQKQGFVFAKSDKKVLTQAIEWADLVHIVMPFKISHDAIKLCKKLDKPCTGAFHVQPENITYSVNLGKNKAVNDFIYFLYRNYIFKNLTNVHCPSNMIANQLKEHKYKSDLHVISNGIDEDFYIKERHEEDDGLFRIMMSGRLSHEKRQDVLIDAIKKSKHKDKIKLMLAGQGPLKEKYMKMGKTLPNGMEINFYDKKGLIDVLSKMNLYVHASDAEIEAISCMEAIATGLVPIIAKSPMSATPQFALDERSLFEAGDSTELAKKIDYWIENNEERLRMEKEYSKNAEKYRLSYCVNKMEDMFDKEYKEFYKKN